jgi:hypothetical protein
MRITVSHDSGKAEAMRAVNGAVDQVLRPIFAGPLPMSSVHKQWRGDTLEFSVSAGLAGAMRTPIAGRITVDERDVTIEVDLPPWLEKLLPKSVRSGVESAVRGLLT